LNKLHHLLAGASHLRPSRFGLWILLDPHDRVSVEHEGYLSKALRLAPSDGIAFGADFHDVGVLYQSLPPDCLQHLIERICGHGENYHAITGWLIV
jgi:hypothetical protein